MGGALRVAPVISILVYGHLQKCNFQLNTTLFRHKIGTSLGGPARPDLKQHKYMRYCTKPLVQRIGGFNAGNQGAKAPKNGAKIKEQKVRERTLGEFHDRFFEPL